MSWEVFVERAQYRKRRNIYPFITIGEAGIWFNRPCVDWLLSNHASALLCLFDSNTNSIAFQATNRSDRRAYVITFNHSAQAHITVKAFIRKVGNPAGRYPATFNDAENRIEVLLSTKEPKP